MFSVTAKLPYNTADTTHNMTAFWKLLSIISNYTAHQEPIVPDLVRQPCTLPASLLTDLRPDLAVHSSGQLHFLELTVCWEANFISAKLRRRANTCTC